MSVMRFQAVKVKISAGHHLDNHPVCGRQHGHEYAVMVTFSGVPPDDNWGELLTPDKIDTIKGVIAEFNGRDVNVMMPTAPATPFNLATYWLERLTMSGAVRVEVHESGTDKVGIAERLTG